MKNVLWIGVSADKGHWNRLKGKLNELNINLNYFEDYDLAICEWETEIKKAVSAASYIIIFVTKSALQSELMFNEIKYAVLEAENRSKTIIPIIQWGETIFKDAPPKISTRIRFLLEKYQWVIPEDGLHSEEDYNRVASYIDGIVSYDSSKQDLYEKIAAFSKMKYNGGIVLNAAKLIQIIYPDLKDASSRHDKYDVLLEICRLLELMNKPFCGYGYETREIAHYCLDVVALLREALEGKDFNTLDMLMAAVAKHVIVHLMGIWCNAIEILSYGDNHSLDSENIKKYTDLYDMYTSICRKQIKNSNMQELAKTYSPEQIRFIIDANKLALTPYSCSGKQESQAQKENLQLVQIAEYLQKANMLFDDLADKTQKISFLRCLKTSYERLQQYCEMGDCLRIGVSCIDKITEINRKIETLSEDQDAFSIEENAFRALLGFKTSVNDEYDVFISYKHEDLDIAYGVYHFINAHLLLPFFDAVTLPEVAKSEYEDVIMNAMENSSHFVVIITELEQLESYWIKLEMNTFHHEIVEGRKENSNFIFLVSDEVFTQIKDSNKNCLNIKFRSYEIIRISQYKNRLLEYLQ